MSDAQRRIQEMLRPFELEATQDILASDVARALDDSSVPEEAAIELVGKFIICSALSCDDVTAEGALADTMQDSLVKVGMDRSRARDFADAITLPEVARAVFKNPAYNDLDVDSFISLILVPETPDLSPDTDDSRNLAEFIRRHRL